MISFKTYECVHTGTVCFRCGVKHPACSIFEERFGKLKKTAPKMLLPIVNCIKKAQLSVFESHVF